MAKKPSGHSAPKANDSFGTINDDSLYRNKYHKDLDKEDDEGTEKEALANPEEETATSQDTRFVQTKKTDQVDIKKRYEDLKKHYYQSLNNFRNR